MADIRISDAEFADRVHKTRQQMTGQDMDALLAFSTESEPAHTRYFADYWPNFETGAVLIPAAGNPALLIGPESLSYARAQSRIARIIRMPDFRESSQPEYPGISLPAWREVLAEFGIKRLGIAGWHMFPHVIFGAIAKRLGVKNIVEADPVVRKVTIVKSDAEICCLREAAQISEIGLQAVLERIKPGMTEAQVVGLATGAMLENGAEATGYAIWCCSGPHSAQAISRPTQRVLERGEVAHVQIGAKVEGYSTSIGRPVMLGSCPDETKRFLQVGCDAENMTIELMRGGVTAGEVARKVHGWITDQGYGDTILYGPAHGCGQMECEWPFVETSSELVLQPNMTFQADVFLARANVGFRWEDAIVVGAGPAEQLSSLRREVIVV
jgi:Xaa-Pro aminopeptidase